MRKRHRVVVGIYDGKKPLGRSRPRWKNYLKLDFAERMRNEVHNL
jgi:hypothetical protein